MENVYDFLSWEHHKPVQPKNITYPDELTPEIVDLRLAITQLNLSKSKQDHLLNEWVELLPTLKKVRQLFFYSAVPQKIFDAVSQMEWLDSLFIKWSGNRIETFEQLCNIKSLRRLYIGNSTKTKDLQFLNGLDNLEWLEINDQPCLKVIDGIEKAHNLKGVILAGGMNRRQKIKDIEPLRHLPKLRYLSLESTFIESENLGPICSIKDLEYLDIPIYYPMKEYAKIAASLPECDHGSNAYRETGFNCSKCRNGIMVKPMKKNSRDICLSCEKDKVEKLILEFDALKNSWLKQSD